MYPLGIVLAGSATACRGTRKLQVARLFAAVAGAGARHKVCDVAVCGACAAAFFCGVAALVAARVSAGLTECAGNPLLGVGGVIRRAVSE